MARSKSKGDAEGLDDFFGDCGAIAGDEVTEINRRRKVMAQTNQNVTRPLPRLGKCSTNKRKHANKKYTPTRMRNAINRYFEKCELTDDIPSISGMMIDLKMYKTDFYKYLKYEGFEDMLEQARLIIKNWAESEVFKSKGQATGKIAYMQNCHGWSEKREQSNENKNVNVEMTAEEARGVLAGMAGPLLEILEGNPAAMRELTENAKKQGAEVESEVVEAEEVESQRRV